ncbi:MAG: FliM/FliN family flagellar motor switch protein [Spirochaetia bacterium]|nr:FliM/FliN family flagellar motor switch protein [Spirochaetia bacterium]
MRTAVSDFINAFASSCSDLLTRALRKRASVQVEEISSTPASDLSDGVMTSPAALLHGPGCTVAVVMERQLAFSVLETLLGGDGKAAVENRPFSDVEQAVAASFMEKLTDCLNSIWRWGSDKDLTQDKMSEYFSESGFPAGKEMLLLAVMNVSWDKSWRKMYICIPESDLDVMESVLKNAFDADGNVLMSVEMGSSSLDKEEAGQLGIGDVVCVAPPQGGLMVRAGKKAFCLAQSGAVGDSVAASILCRYEGQDTGTPAVSALLGTARRHWKDVLALDTGDLLVLDRTRMSPVPLMVSGQLKAEGQVIVIDKRLGVRIKKLL